MKGNLCQNVHGNMVLSVYIYKCYEYDVTLPSRKQT